MPTLKDLKQLLLKHEGLKLKPYKDTVGKLTIGIGRNLDDVGISKEEAEILLENDIKRVTSQLETLSVYRRLSDIRKMVLIDMAFNLGFQGLLGFVKMWGALAVFNYELAAKEMLDSKWALQVKSRAQELAKMMRSNECST